MMTKVKRPEPLKLNGRTVPRLFAVTTGGDETNKIRLGVLPLSRYLNGHTYFVSRSDANAGLLVLLAAERPPFEPPCVCAGTARAYAPEGPHAALRSHDVPVRRRLQIRIWQAAAAAPGRPMACRRAVLL